MTDGCRSCYAQAGEKVMMSMAGSHAANTVMAKSDPNRYADIAIAEIHAEQARRTRMRQRGKHAPPYRLIRIHGYGDFVGPAHVRAWGRIADAFPSIRFFGTTRAWQLYYRKRGDFLEALDELRRRPNVFLGASIYQETRDWPAPDQKQKRATLVPFLKRNGWNIWNALLDYQIEANRKDDGVTIARSGTQHALIRDQFAKAQKAGRMIGPGCYEQAGTRANCSTCGHCAKKGADVTFAYHVGGTKKTTPGGQSSQFKNTFAKNLAAMQTMDVPLGPEAAAVLPTAEACAVPKPNPRCNRCGRSTFTTLGLCGPCHGQGADEAGDELVRRLMTSGKTRAQAEAERDRLARAHGPRTNPPLCNDCGKAATLVAYDQTGRRLSCLRCSSPKTGNGGNAGVEEWRKIGAADLKANPPLDRRDIAFIVRRLEEDWALGKEGFADPGDHGRGWGVEWGALLTTTEPTGYIVKFWAGYGVGDGQRDLGPFPTIRAAAMATAREYEKEVAVIGNPGVAVHWARLKTRYRAGQGPKGVFSGVAMCSRARAPVTRNEYRVTCQRCKDGINADLDALDYEMQDNPGEILDSYHARPGDRVTFAIPDRRASGGYRRGSGRIVMAAGTGNGWVLNTGGAHGTPQVIDHEHVVKVTRGQRHHGFGTRMPNPGWTRIPADPGESRWIAGYSLDGREIQVLSMNTTGPYGRQKNYTVTDGKRSLQAAGRAEAEKAVARLQEQSIAGYVRSNPSLILVGNPQASTPAEIEDAWCKFHQRDTFKGRKETMNIPGTPPFVFALGELVDIDVGGGLLKPSPRPLLVCNPKDDSLWIVSHEPMDVRDLQGRRVVKATYDPVGGSGKEKGAVFRHKFDAPHPVFSPIGDARKCRAALLEGGTYTVDDWIRN